ncbi:T9SS type A sorting domain-containing protein [candidate division KSB1 bacterium]|nr:T9SS type A sorting domain-containing protein [candidate division KSB1 bacterium]
MKRWTLYGLMGCLLLSINLSAKDSVRFQYRKNQPSRRNLVTHSQYSWQSDALILRSGTTLQTAPDSLHILALMVAFQPDEDGGTNGDGLFDLSIPELPVIDPPPHNQSYFEDQLTALSNYYRTVSSQKLGLGFTVHPYVLNLPNHMAEYNPASSDAATDQGLAELFRDAITLADDYGVVFSDYDVYVVFHAGVGKDIDLGYDPTPRDIPSAFLTVKDLRKYLADEDPTYDGIAVEDGSFFVTEGLILPETQSQEGYEIGLIGTMTLMFGFQLGLPALWNTQNGYSGIGRWGLMDQGSGNFNGLLPAEPCAWSKVFMGWQTPIEVRTQNDLDVACSIAGSAPAVYKVSISTDEYFLIENRQYDPNGDGVSVGRDASGQEVRFLETGQIEAEEAVGVIVEIDEYDYGIPGSGILIWHIDESILRDKIADNQVNTDRHHRAVDLEEADGAQDIGESYGMIDPGAGAESGVWHDAFWASNEINLLGNNFDSVAFTPDTHPNSRSYSGANSHIVISGFSESDTVMSFSVSNDLNQTGFPAFFESGLDAYPPITGDINGDGFPEIVVATREGKVFAWQADGSPLVDSGDIQYRVSFTGDTTYYPSALFLDVGDSILIPPVIFDVNHDGLDDELVLAKGDNVRAYHIRDDAIEMIIDNQLPSGTITALTAWDRGIIIGTNEGVVRAIDQHNQMDWESDAGNGSAVVGLCRVESSYLLVTLEDGGAAILPANEFDHTTSADGPGETGIPIGFPVNLNSPTIEQFPLLAVYARSSTGGVILWGDDETGLIESQQFEYPGVSESFIVFAAGEIDVDGIPELICTAQGQVWAFNHNGSLCNGFPVPTFERDVELSSPIVADTDGDEIPEILVTTSEGNLEIVSTDGSRESTSLPLGGPSTITPRVCDLDGDEDIEVIAVSEEGTLSVFDLAGSPEDIQWAGYQNDSGHSGWLQIELDSPTSKADFFPTNLAYNYPNPNIENYTIIRYRLEQSASVQIKIYDLSGDRVASFTGPGVPMTDNEIVWDLDDVDSGVYFCQVTATSNAGEKTTTFKIAVVK